MCKRARRGIRPAVRQLAVLRFGVLAPRGPCVVRMRRCVRRPRQVGVVSGGYDTFIEQSVA